MRRMGLTCLSCTVLSAACAAFVTKYIFGVTNKANPAEQETVMPAFSEHDEGEGEKGEEEKEPEQPLEGEGEEVYAEKEA